MHQHDAPARVPDADGGLGVLMRARAEHLPPSQADEVRHVCGGDGDDDVAHRVAQDAGDRHRQDESREGEHHIHDPHDEIVHPAAVVAGQPSNEGAQEEGAQGDGAGDGQVEAGGVYDTREHVPPKLVGPKGGTR